ncbi:hypothetical protein D3C74_418050 [compost metagenome]
MLSVVRILRITTDPFTVAQWLCSVVESDPLERTPLQVLAAGSLTRLLVRALESQARWSM